MLWWPEGRLDAEPEVWTAPADTVAPPSDPAPSGRGAPSTLPQPTEWRAEAARIADLPMRDLTVVGPDGFPLPLPVREVEPVPEGFRLRVAAGAGPIDPGPACLTFHTHSVPFIHQQNRMFAGVERRLADWSIPPTAGRATLDFLGKGRRLRPRLRAEARRRGQRPPKVNLPA